MNDTQTNCNTRKSLAKKQYTNMGKISVISQEKKQLNIKNTVAAEQTMLNKTNPITKSAGLKISALMTEVLNARNYIVEEISTTFEKKLEKLDEAIIELINCKTENERLKAKIDNLTRENYRLKKEVESYKTIVPGVFIKLKKDTVNL